MPKPLNRRITHLGMSSAAVQPDESLKQALGKANPRWVFVEVLDLLAGALAEHRDQAEELAKQQNLPGDLEDLLALLSEMNPVEFLNQFHYQNPQFNLQDPLKKETPLSALRAVLSMVLDNDRWQAM
jgi:hypothetical protein